MPRVAVCHVILAWRVQTNIWSFLTTCGVERALSTLINMEREVLDLRNQFETCRSELESISCQLEETNERVAESQQYQNKLEEKLTEEKRQGRLRELEAKDKVRDRAERTLDELHIERDRLKSDFQHELGEKMHKLLLSASNGKG